jgi:hypothetical protein
MNSIIEYFLLDWGQVVALGSILLWAAALSALGRLTTGRNRLAEADLIYGWALISVVFTTLGLISTLSFTIIAYGLLAVAAVAIVLIIRRDGHFLDPGLRRLALLSIPLLVLVADMVPSQWDEFTNWLPNVRYLLEYDGFPRGVRSNDYHPHPAYPYGLPLMIYLASRIAGGLVEHSGAVFNLLFYLSFGAVIARVIHMGVTEHDRSAAVTGPLGWGYYALGGLAMTALSPTFVPKVVFTAYADAGTAVALGLAGVLGWMLLDALERNDKVDARRLAWQFSLAAVVLINLKQANFTLLAAVLAGIAYAGWRDKRIQLAPLLRLLALAVLLPVAVWAMWRLYVTLHISEGEFVIRSFSEWRFDLIQPTLERMALIASKKGGYFGLMLVAVGFAVRASVRVTSRWDRLALITAITFVGYNAALLYAYIASFGENDARRAASYWRYNMHLGGLAVAFGAYGLALLWRFRPANWARIPFAGIAVVLILILPAALSGKLRFDDRPPKHYVRAVGDEMSHILKPDMRLAIIDPSQDGFYGVLLRYALNRSVEIVAWVSAYTKADRHKIRTYLDETSATHAWVHVATPDVEAVLGASLSAGSSHLLRRDPSGWKIMRSWPYPGYAHPNDLPD